MLKQPRLWFGFVILFMASGLSLRLASYNWNTRLFGDVNLFALSARELALHGKLQYPMKYDYSENALYLTLTTPASQHPPLWPWLGGITARVLGNLDTFAILKGLGVLAGMVLLAALVATGWFADMKTEGLISLGLAAISPALVDFSANGSLYILSSLLVILGSLLLLRFNPNKVVHFLLAGLLCGLGYLTHSSLILLPIAYLLPILIYPKTDRGLPMGMPDKTNPTIIVRQRIIRLGLFLLAFLTIISPWLGWNLRNFGRPFYSLSSLYFFDKLGLLKIGVYGDTVSARLSEGLSLRMMPNYAHLAAKAWAASSRQFYQNLGPFILFLAIMGLARLIIRQRTHLYAFTFPAVLYGLAITLWATNKYRFLIPLLGPTYLLAAMGLIFLFQLGLKGKWLGWSCLIGGLVWMGMVYRQPQPALYYGNQTPQVETLYDRMRPLAEKLAEREKGVTLGIARTLDGGIETIYWSDFPFIAGRDMRVAEIRKLGEDFQARYVWADEMTLSLAKKAFPSAQVILDNPPFYVLEREH